MPGEVGGVEAGVGRQERPERRKPSTIPLETMYGEEQMLSRAPFVEVQLPS